MTTRLSGFLVLAALWGAAGCGDSASPPGEDVDEADGEEADDIEAGDRDEDAGADADADGDDEAGDDGDEDEGADDDGGPGCEPDTDCNDEVDCTTDRCDPTTGLCSNEPHDASCNDADDCNGIETCNPTAGCVAGVPPDCDDGIDCTVDSCNPVGGACSRSPVDAACDDWDDCNGIETCQVGVGCVLGTPPDCDDGVDCTLDSCDPSDGACLHMPDDTACPPSPLCSGIVFCDRTAGCMATPPPACDDGVDCTLDACEPSTGDCVNLLSDAACDDTVFCNGAETCDGALGCIPGAPPACDDRLACTDDACDPVADMCEWTPVHARCLDADLCDGIEVCNLVLGCIEGITVACDDGIPCTTDSCNPLTGGCLAAPDHSACDNGLWCDGPEACDVVRGCVAGIPPVCDDGISCTIDLCIEATDSCGANPDHSACVAGEVCVPALGGCVPGMPCMTDAECSDGQFCNGAERCVATVCQGGTPPSCSDGIACTTDWCDPTAPGGGACRNTPPDADRDGYPAISCGGTDCNDADPAINPGASDGLPCDGVDNDCDTVTDGGLRANGASCTTSTQCCSGSCVAGSCTSGYGLCEGPGTPCATSAECCSGRCEVDISGTRVCVGVGACQGEGGTCLFASDCCSTYCLGGVCAVGSTCRVVGTTCTSNFACCSGICSGGICQSIGGSCRPIGETCSSNGGCCSGLCVGGRCALSFFCRASGELCNENADCCNSICDGYTPPTPGRCAFLGGCLTVGQPCTGNRNCCSKACVDPGTGVRVCTYLSGCRPIGEVCSVNGECCGRLCRLDDGGLSMRCQNPPGCQPAGEMCFAGATNNCCGGKENCRPTIAGVYRCWTPGWTTCLPAEDVCVFGDECCSGVCTLRTDGTYRCGAACVPSGGTCRADADCCAPMVCRGGLCVTETSCIPLGGACTRDIDCCSNRCFGGFCQIPIDG